MIFFNVAILKLGYNRSIKGITSNRLPCTCTSIAAQKLHGHKESIRTHII